MMSHISVGLNGRFFASNWRPALQEIDFAGQHGFRCIQFQGPEFGLSESGLGADFAAVARALRGANLVSVMEIPINIGVNGRTRNGCTPLDILHANLPAILALPCAYVHWHLAPINELSGEENTALERSLVSQMTEAVSLSTAYGFVFGFEHNEPALQMFATPESCAWMLARVENLRFVWDFNHTTPQDLAGFSAIIPRMSALHVSDTPLPEVNYHWPVGRGTVDFAAYGRLLRHGGFNGPAVLEIGGLPKSGGYGQDTDAALIDSLRRLEAAFA